MLKRIFLGIIVLGAFTWLIRSAYSRPTSQREGALRLLERSSAAPLKIRYRGGIPAVVAMDVAVPAGLPDDPVVQALDFLERFKELYRIRDPRSQLYLNRIKSDSSEHHLFFRQKVDDIPVFAGELAVHIRRRRILLTNGHYLDTVPSSPRPNIDSTRAKAIALAESKSPLTSVSGPPRLMYFNLGLLKEGKEATRLAWRVGLRGTGQDAFGGLGQIFVDAQDGGILLALSQAPSGSPSKDFLVESAFHSVVGGCLDDFNETEDETWFVESGPTSEYPGPAQDAFNDALKSFNLTHQVYDFFHSNFGRHSWDDDEEEVWIMTHVGNSAFSGVAQYNGGGCIRFKDGTVSLDLMGHEWSHAIDDHEGELIYAHQSGALDESFADFFGCMLDPDWTIGEDQGNSNQPFRDMSNPAAFGHPGHIKDYQFMFDDFGGVHTNSGIPNLAAFLITEGGKNHGFEIKGMGRKKTQGLYYHVLTNVITGAPSFTDFRNLLWFSAYLDHSMGGKLGITEEDLCTIANSFASVGIEEGFADSDCDGNPDKDQADNDNDYIPDDEDNCPNISNPGKADQDGDGVGDLCDEDIDGDGWLDGDDNCPLAANPGQEDADKNKVGDICQDDDGDGHPNIDDICPWDYDRYQTDTDLDGMGDACDEDDDNDFKADGRDNCPRTANSGQENTDSDGLGNACDNCPAVTNQDQKDCDLNNAGRACDLGEKALYKDNCMPWSKMKIFVHPGDMVSLPGCAHCGDWIGNGFESKVNVSGPDLGALAIVDETGKLIARGAPGKDQLLTFNPKAGSAYRPPGSSQAHFQGIRYFLRIPVSKQGYDGFEIQYSVETLKSAH